MGEGSVYTSWYRKADCRRKVSTGEEYDLYKFVRIQSDVALYFQIRGEVISCIMSEWETVGYTLH